MTPSKPLPHSREYEEVTARVQETTGPREPRPPQGPRASHPRQSAAASTRRPPLMGPGWATASRP